MPRFDIPIDSFESFKNYVNGKAFDWDSMYGAQCWDGLQILWDEVGMFLSTDGTHHVYGCWNERVRASNAGSEFDLVYNLGDVRTGDVMIFNHNVGVWGDDGHGGYACEDYNGSGRILLLSQNYYRSTAQGSPFHIDNVNVTGFLGAFRFKRWEGGTPPSPEMTRSHFPWVITARNRRTRQF